MNLENLNKITREKSLDKMKIKDIDRLATSWFQKDLLYSGIGDCIFLILPTPGCSWALSGSGGCTMCSYISDCSLEPIEPSKVIELFEREISKYKIKKPTAIKLFASGSFLNPEEVPIAARDEILKSLSENEAITEIVVESRPEYVDENILREIMKILKDKIFEISIGLEAEDDEIREGRINKGFTKEDFEKAITTIKSLKKEYNIKSKAYILVKPILTSEEEAINEAIATARYAENVGVDRISFCPATIHKGTTVERLWRNGAYEPPWIWSVIEIINTTRKLVEIPAFMDTSGFGSRRGPYNCKKCNKPLKHAIIESNLNQEQVETIECSCRNDWIADKKFSDMNFSTSFTKFNEYK